VKIGINALQVRGAKSGVGQYIACFVQALLQVDRENEYVLFANEFNRHNYEFRARNYQLRTWGSRSKRKPVRLVYEHAFLPSEIKREQFDLFHGPSNFLPLWKVCPYIVTMQDMSYFGSVSKRRYTRSKVLYWRLMTKRTVAVADMIIASSAYSKQDILRYVRYPEEKVRVIWLAAHPVFRRVEDAKRIEDFRQRFELPERYVLFVGTLEPGKNIVRLVRAFERLRRTVSDCQLILVGDRGWLYDDIFATIEERKLGGVVRYVGHVSDEDLCLFYNAASVVALPSLNEGFGLPVVEAMNCGTPIVVSNLSSLPEVAGDAALQVDPLDEEGLARALERAICDSTLREALIQKGYERAKEFSWEKTARAILEVYQRVVEDCRRSRTTTLIRK
jgi:glycosyltransferase involved in cell wall biosynthesis